MAVNGGFRSDLSITHKIAGLEIVTDMVANATKTFNLATKNSSVVATLATMLPLQPKNRGEEQFLKSRFCFSAKRKCKLSLFTFLKKLALRHCDRSRRHYSGFYVVIAGAIFC